MPTPTPNQSLFDPRNVLATSLSAQPGVYALLLGSGISKPAGIPTGWGVVEALVNRLASADGTAIPDGDDWESWWVERTDNEPLGYSTLLERVASTPAARRQILAGFFEPDDDDLAEGRKTATAAHQAIASLVARGLVRVIVTTNFDRLTEQALEAAGVFPQVIATEAAVAGMEPLQHARATVVKLHGDYASLDQKNTVTELSSYSASTDGLLRRILDEYGLIVTGWSGDWDTALVAAVEATANRRYPLYWVTNGDLGTVGKQLTARNGAAVVEHTDADTFFTDLLDRVDAVETLRTSASSLPVKLARQHRDIADPTRRIRVRDALLQEIEPIEAWAADRPSHAPSDHYQTWEDEIRAALALTAPLLTLYADGIALDEDRLHDRTWQLLLQRTLDARPVRYGNFDPRWDALAHLPAALLLRAGVIGAIVGGREDVAAMLCDKPSWSDAFATMDVELHAHEALHTWEIFDARIIRGLPSTTRPNVSIAASKLIRDALRPSAEHLVGARSAGKTLDRMEYRIAVANTVLPAARFQRRGAPGGLYVGDWTHNESAGQPTPYRADFTRAGSSAAWDIAALGDLQFAAALDALDERIRELRDDT